jgi:hypothetical protein
MTLQEPRDGWSLFTAAGKFFQLIDLPLQLQSDPRRDEAYRIQAQINKNAGLGIFQCFILRREACFHDVTLLAYEYVLQLQVPLRAPLHSDFVSSGSGTVSF